MARNPKIRQEKLSVAVIGEGLTEWHYFNDLKQNEQLSFNLRPSFPKHSSFDSICAKAIDLVIEGYDSIFCIIDLDYIRTNPTNLTAYSTLKTNIQRDYNNVVFFECMPCIELWFLLHFKRTTRIFRNYREIRPEIELLIPNYSKSDKFLKKINLYHHLKSENKLDIAKANSQWLIEQKNQNQNPLHPFSEIHLLIERLV